MIRLFFVALFLVVGLNISLTAMIPMPMYDFDTMRQMNDVDYLDDRSKLEKVQAHYIEQFLTRPIFDSNLSDMLVDEDEEESMFAVGLEEEFLNNLLASEIAKELARQDILQFDKLMRMQRDIL